MVDKSDYHHYFMSDRNMSYTVYQRPVTRLY